MIGDYSKPLAKPEHEALVQMLVSNVLAKPGFIRTGPTKYVLEVALRKAIVLSQPGK